MRSNYQSSLNQLNDDLKAVAHDTEELLKVCAGQLNDQGKEVYSRLRSRVDDARASCVRLEKRAVENTIAAAKVADRTVRAHPYESIGAALGLGLLIGVLVSRR